MDDPKSDWFVGDVDCDGNELITVRKDEWDTICEQREKFMWQVRDTCTRAEKAETRLAEVEAEREGHPFERLRKIIHDDLEYAWAWQCNLAVPIMDATPCTHAQANEAAALIMAQMFGYDITDHPEYTAGKSPAQEYFEMRVDAEKEEFRAAIAKAGGQS